MKTVGVLLLAAVFLLSPLYSQTSIGIIGGPAAANFSTDDDESDIYSMAAYGIGGVLEFGFTPIAALRFEPMFLQKGAESDVYIDDFYEFTGMYKINYLEIPVLLKAEFYIPYVFAGPSIGLLLNSKLVTEAEQGNASIDTKDVTESMDVSAVVGAGLNFSFGLVSLFLEGRYQLGLTDILKDGTIYVLDEPIELAGTVKNRGTQVMIGVMFGI